MKSYRKELWFNIPARRGFVNITAQVEACLEESGIQEGLILINASLLHFHHQNRPVAQLLAVYGSPRLFHLRSYKL